MLKRIRCKCGRMPLMDKLCGDNGSSYNGVMWRLECPKCGDKDAPWLRSQLMACAQWESKYYSR